MTHGFKVTLFSGLHAKTKEEREVGFAEFAALIQITRVLVKGRLPLLKLATFGDRKSIACACQLARACIPDSPPPPPRTAVAGQNRLFGRCLFGWPTVAQPNKPSILASYLVGAVGLEPTAR
jgi:hypothetical protein